MRLYARPASVYTLFRGPFPLRLRRVYYPLAVSIRRSKRYDGMRLLVERERERERESGGHVDERRLLRVLNLADIIFLIGKVNGVPKPGY